MTKEAKRARRVYLRLFILLKCNVDAFVSPRLPEHWQQPQAAQSHVRYARHCELEGWPGAVSNNDCHLRRILVD